MSFVQFYYYDTKYTNTFYKSTFVNDITIKIYLQICHTNITTTNGTISLECTSMQEICTKYASSECHATKVASTLP